MTQDPYWDELGVAWVAAEASIDAVTPQLERRFRRQALLMKAGGLLAVAISLLGLILGVATIWIGMQREAWNFVSRGAGLIVIALLSALAAGALSQGKAGDQNCPLLQMIELSISRGRQTLRTIRLALWACAVGGVFGIVGSVIRISLSGPPKMSPVVDLALLALVALALILYGQKVKLTLAKFEYLQRVLSEDAVLSLGSAT